MKKPKTAISSGSHWLGPYLPRDGGLLLKSTLRSRLYWRVPGVLKKAHWIRHHFPVEKAEGLRTCTGKRPLSRKAKAP
ncbi:unnamed protein product [Sphagnum jensenii]|uniref:Uncharacterized protein n=1 Tax=Sphagnum jensenii TaxID=128206 RepID=A0ABP0VSU7_9BRYO